MRLLVRSLVVEIVWYGWLQMEHEHPTSPKEPTIRDLFPDLDDDALRVAEERFDDYIAFTVRLYERIAADPDAYARFKALTESRRQSYDRGKGRLTSQ